MHSTAVWHGNMKFIGSAGSGHEIIMDAAPASGGDNQGSRPKEMILHGLAGCTAMDVISILKKMRQPVEAFRVEVDVIQSEEHPKIFSKIHIRYIFKGDIPLEKLEKAVDLSQNTYCGVSAMLRKSSDLTHEIIQEV